MLLQTNSVLDHPSVKSFINAFEKSQFCLTITDASTGKSGQKMLFVNEAFTQMTGYTGEELIGKTPRILQGPKTDRVLLDELKESIYQGKTFIGQTINYRKDGTEYIVRWSINPIFDEAEKIIAFLSCQLEVKQQVNKDNIKHMLTAALDQTRDGVMVTNLFGEILYTNKAFANLTGYSQDEMLGQTPRLFHSGQMENRFYKNLWQTLIENKPFEGVFINRNKSGHEYYEYKTITPVFDETLHPIYFVSISRDATQSIKYNHNLAYQAYHDPLTGLYNRAKLNETIEFKQQTMNQPEQPFSMILGDIDDFKKLNDTYGHDMGDQVLKRVAQTLKTSLRKSDFVARWGGEEFVVLVDTDIEDATRIAESLLTHIRSMDTNDLTGHPVTLSFGVATYQQGMTMQRLFNMADKGLYQAKKEGKNCVKIHQ